MTKFFSALIVGALMLVSAADAGIFDGWFEGKEPDPWRAATSQEELTALTIADLVALKKGELSYLPECGSAVYRGRQFQKDARSRLTVSRDGDMETLSIMNDCGTAQDVARVCALHPDRTYVRIVGGRQVEQACAENPAFAGQQVAGGW